jgi:hypothetical protein
MLMVAFLEVVGSVVRRPVDGLAELICDDGLDRRYISLMITQLKAVGLRILVGTYTCHLCGVNFVVPVNTVKFSIHSEKQSQ